MNIQEIIYIVKADRARLLGLLVVILALCTIYYARDNRQDMADETLDTLNDATGRKKPEPMYYAAEQTPVCLQPFDPNTADSTLLLSLGLQPWQVRSIYRYRAHGGVYTCPEDFARLYGLTVKKYRELRPYIRIGEEYRPAADVYARKPKDTERQTAAAAAGATQQQKAYQQKISKGETVAVNTADTTQLCRVPGIGPYFARRITRYRERLGGFVSKSQLLEIDDFPESALDYLAIDMNGETIKKININKATNEQMRTHPYITYLMARQITDYRRLKGHISDLSDLRLLPTFTPEAIERLRPYIEY
ncbi:MAG: helix-hairpin-helix domain-containing protein [Prevotella sp.]